ncbi:hypothetical protein [Anabaena subtropica]|uniref:Uncharacterized protein n=1 Tax=Anabaena subtropica FACHB-260 TaxID=2692884 RepID=A0ABR8CLZ5_9NOST|nr:hypothetical protein [Anabaena subtropica]MBD2344266.1 hypothetical protein [Anabaena subtropica FACHB-260]
MTKLNFEPGKIYEMFDINNLRVLWRLKYLETVLNPDSKEICLHFEELESSTEKQKDIYLNQNDIYQQIGGINEAMEYQVRYEY